ncbi:hypothetical protein HO173_012227 [Letharia columbiana]|uniref:Uncharacterized protein n=1 Tax=Letharia columbiana TaxID=112416 RepID=A0A8H6CPZ7_9LECA|nr:uncharacterized protein HO173_012227 [Letharia columbiana]KAF6227487.1 hypothetical protein HO173_012227 [Letharia columbiana]
MYPSQQYPDGVPANAYDHRPSVPGAPYQYQAVSPADDYQYQPLPTHVAAGVLPMTTTNAMTNSHLPPPGTPLNQPVRHVQQGDIIVNVPAIEDQQQIVRGTSVRINSSITSHDPATVVTGIFKAYDLEKTLPDNQSTKHTAEAPVPNSNTSEAGQKPEDLRGAPVKNFNGVWCLEPPQKGYNLRRLEEADSCSEFYVADGNGYTAWRTYLQELGSPVKQSGLQEKEPKHAKERNTGLRSSNQYDTDNPALPPAKALQMERPVTLSIPETTQSRE